MKKTIIFDFDGTIADTFTTVIVIANELAKKHHYKQVTSEEDIERLRGQNAFQVLKELHIPFYKVPFILKDGKEELEKSIHKIKPIEGLLDVLRALKKKGYVLGMATSNSRANIDKFLKIHNVEVFDFIHCDISIMGKAGVLRKLLDKKGIKPESAVYIGDEVRDVESAQRISLPVVAVTWGFNSRALLKAEEPDYLVDTPQELEALFP